MQSTVEPNPKGFKTIHSMKWQNAGKQPLDTMLGQKGSKNRKDIHLQIKIIYLSNYAAAGIHQ